MRRFLMASFKDGRVSWPYLFSFRRYGERFVVHRMREWSGTTSRLWRVSHAATGFSVTGLGTAYRTVFGAVVVALRVLRDRGPNQLRERIRVSALWRPGQRFPGVKSR